MGTKGIEQGAFLRARPSIRCWQSLSAGEEYADPPPPDTQQAPPAGGERRTPLPSRSLVGQIAQHTKHNYVEHAMGSSRLTQRHYPTGE